MITTETSPVFCTVGRFYPGFSSKKLSTIAKKPKDIIATYGQGATRFAIVGATTPEPTAKVRVSAAIEPTFCGGTLISRMSSCVLNQPPSPVIKSTLAS